jgi:hypothetical protein
MKITFYADVPEYLHADTVIFATSRTFGPPAGDLKRVKFEVEFPPDVLKEADHAAETRKTTVLRPPTIPSALDPP